MVVVVVVVVVVLGVRRKRWDHSCTTNPLSAGSTVQPPAYRVAQERGRAFGARQQHAAKCLLAGKRETLKKKVVKMAHTQPPFVLLETNMVSDATV